MASARMAAEGPLVVVDQVTKTYDGRVPVHALRGITMTIEPGEMVAIMGPSGSGKSTLLNLMGGLDVPTGGRVVVAGADLGDLDEAGRSLFRRRHVSYVFQAAHLMPTLTCVQNVALPLHLLGLPTREIAMRVDRVLEELGLETRRAHLADELSGGERQRVAVARALVTTPQLILADEPTGNLDSVTSDQILELFTEVQRRRQSAVVLVTHDPHAAGSCRRIVRIRDGRVESDAVV